MAVLRRSIYGKSRLAVLGAAPVNPAEQDVGISKNFHLSRVFVPLIFASVDALPAQSLVRDGGSPSRNQIGNFFEGAVQLFGAQLSLAQFGSSADDLKYGSMN